MLSLKHNVAKTRALLSPILLLNKSTHFISSSHADSTHFYVTTACSLEEVKGVSAKEVALSFKEWFKNKNYDVLDRIFEILRTHKEEDLASRSVADLALSQLGLCLTEPFVLKVLYHDNGKDVLSCLKFFDWAGRQPGFHHTRATFYAIFKILSKAKLMSLTSDFLENYMKQRFFYRVRFHDTLVMGYAVAGRPELALQLFGKMRFQGLDLDPFGYNVLLNALVEESCFDAVDVISKQISLRGFDNEVTRSIVLKSLCKQNQLDEAEECLHKWVREGEAMSDYVLAPLVEGLCKRKRFEQAGKLLEEFRKLGVVPLDHAYGIWLQNLAQARRLDAALEFLESKKSLEGYVPEVFRYNVLVSRLLQENRLMEVFDLLMEMKQDEISADKITMNNALCFFCKAGMVDVALELYNSRLELGLSLNGMVYNYLINTLCGDGSTDEAYRVLKNNLGQGFFPGRKTFSILASALCREGKLDMMKELLIFALERNFMPSDSTYDMFISALCKARMIEDAYLIHGELDRINKVSNGKTYSKLIHGFYKLNRGDIAARLLIEMQEKGHKPNRVLFRPVIFCLCDMENPKERVLQLLEMQLSRHGNNTGIYNLFIDGAGHARRPELAREVYEMIRRSGLEPNLSSNILLLQSYLRSERFAEAFIFFYDLRNKGKVGIKLYNTMVVYLCKAKRAYNAFEVFRDMRNNGFLPSNECYEVLIQLLCSTRNYDLVVHLINDLEKVRHHVSPFIGNTLLLHSLKTQDFYEAWIQLIDLQNETSKISLLGQLIGAFCGRIRVSNDLDNLEEVIEQCFPLNIYTYNILLQRLVTSEMDRACELFNRLRHKGYEPNQWTYSILIHALYRSGKTDEAKRMVEEMFQKGLDPPIRIKRLI